MSNDIRRYLNLVEESLLETPTGSNNYWVTADGTFQQVEFHRHSEFAAKAFGLKLYTNHAQQRPPDTVTEDETYGVAFAHGWIRIAMYDRGAHINFSPAVSPAAMRSLIDYVKHENFAYYAVDVDEVAHQTFDENREAIAFLRRDWKRSRAVTEASERVSIGYRGDITVWRDLSKQALVHLALKHDLRCISTDKHFWVWQAFEAIHRDVARALGVETGKENYTYISCKSPGDIDVQEWRGNGPRYPIEPPVYCYWGMTGDPLMTKLGDYFSAEEEEDEEK